MPELIIPRDFQPEPLIKVDRELLVAQGIYVLDTEIDLGRLAAATANSPSSDLVAFDYDLKPVANAHPLIQDSLEKLIAELEDHGFFRADAVLNAVGIYREKLREDDGLPQGTYVDRLHRDESFQAAIAVTESPSWYYVNPDGRAFECTDYWRHELSIGDSFNWENVKVAPVGRWVFHTQQVPHSRPPCAVGSSTRGTAVYRRFLEL